MVDGEMELIVGTGFGSGGGAVVGADPTTPQPENKSADVRITRIACENLVRD
jgi:hypothetical protein